MQEISRKKTVGKVVSRWRVLWGYCNLHDIDWVKTLHATRLKIGHFGNVKCLPVSGSYMMNSFLLYVDITLYLVGHWICKQEFTTLTYGLF